MKRHLYLLIALTLLVMCASTPTKAQHYARVVGRFIIHNPEGKTYKKTKIIYFSELYLNNFKSKIDRNDSGYFSIKLPLGYNYLTSVHYFDQAEFIKNFPVDYLQIKVSSKDSIIYAGDILLTWDINTNEVIPPSEHIGGALLGPIGAIIDRQNQLKKAERVGAESLPVTVNNNPETIAHFANEYDIPATEILQSLVKVRK